MSLSSADILSRLSALDISAEAMREVMSIIAGIQSADDERKRKDRERKRTKVASVEISPSAPEIPAEIPRSRIFVPPPPPAPIAVACEGEETAIEVWQRFDDAYPWTDTMSRTRAMSALLELSADEQHAAIAAIPAFCADRQFAEPVAAASYLRDRLFANYALPNGKAA